MKYWFIQIISLIEAELISYFRIRLAIFSSFLTPVVMMLAFGLGTNNHHPSFISFNFILPGIFATGLMFSSTFSSGFTIISDKQQRLIYDIILSPISYSSFVIARTLSTVYKSFITLAITTIMALIFKVHIQHGLWFFYTFIFTSIFFSGIGMIFGTFTNALTFQGMINVLILPFMFFCGVFFPVTNFGILGSIVKFLPLSISVEFFRYSIYGGYLEYGLLFNATLLLVFSVCSVGVGLIVFRKTIK